MKTRLITTLLIATWLTGCAVNPVTGKSEFMIVSEQEELALGQQNYAPMQQAQGGVYDVDPELTSYVQEVGARLAAVSDRQLPYEFVVLNNSVPNAWALPGGKIAINRGLLTELNSEAELAAVLGHEIVHAAAKHSAQQMSRGAWLQGVIMATAIATGGSDYGQLVVGGAAAGAQLINSTYGRSAEQSERWQDHERHRQQRGRPVGRAFPQDFVFANGPSRHQQADADDRVGDDRRLEAIEKATAV